MAFIKGTKSEVVVKVIAKLFGDGGKEINVPFKVRYRRLKHSEATSFVEQLKADEITDDDLIRKTVLGWSELPDENGEEVPFNDDTLNEILELTPYRKALVFGFMKQQYEIDLKNQ